MYHFGKIIPMSTSLYDTDSLISLCGAFLVLDAAVAVAVAVAVACIARV